MGKYLILGAGGQLGRAFVQQLEDENMVVQGLGRNETDLARPDELRLDMRGVDVVVNCAAYTNVDGAEEDEELATRINADAVGQLARICKEAGATLVHFSTDYVFDGQATKPYAVDHPKSPVNAYGRTKHRGEEQLEDSEVDHLLIRTSWVYAPWGKNFVKTMARMMKERDTLNVVDDQRGRPTHVTGLAERTLQLLRQKARGTFHITDGGECTWFGFAQAIAEAIDAKCTINPCTSAEFPRPAPRPAYSVLDTSRADELLGPALHYRQWLERTAPHL